jgi:histidinol dehydrogenase
LVAADIAGADEIYKMGGAQAVAALAYGTKSVPCVHKITGPGNIFVATAKKQVFGKVGIDMIAGPSEVLVIDDASCDVSFIAADILSQAEHDELASCIGVCLSKERAQQLQTEIVRQLDLLPKKEIAQKSLSDYGVIMVAKDVHQALSFSNEVAPEHLELCIKDAEQYLNDVKNAGAVFLGAYSPEPLGDYFAGPNHVLPTNGTAKFSSPLNVDDFMKKSSIICYDKKRLYDCYQDIETLAVCEGLQAHANSVKIRFEKNI